MPARDPRTRREFVGPEIGAERAEERTYDRARKERRVISGVRRRVGDDK